MRYRLTAAAPLLLAVAVARAQAPAPASDPGGLSTPVLSQCLAAVDLGPQGGESAYAAVAFDGLPWLKVETVDTRLGSRTVWSRAAGSGTWWRHDGVTVPLRFVCELDTAGKALKLRSSPIIASRDEPLPPHRLLAGTATWAPGLAAPADSELRVQLRDQPTSAIVAEQVVRVGRNGPVAFALRLPPGATPTGRTLALEAVVVQGGFVRAGLRQPRPLAESDLKGSIALTLE